MVQNRLSALRVMVALLFVLMFLPFPALAVEIEKIGDGVYAHIGEIAIPDQNNAGDASNWGIIIGDDAVMVVDSGGSAVVGQGVLNTIRALTDLPIKYLVITHVHPDHIYGAKTLVDAGAELIGHVNLADAIAAREDSYAQNYAQTIGQAALENADIPSVNVIVEQPMEFDLGNRIVQLRPMSIAHTNNDLTVFDKNSGTLFLGDLLFEEHVPVIDGSLRGWQEVMNEIELDDVHLVVPGHGQFIKNEVNKEGLWGKQSAYFEALANDAKTAIENGDYMSDAIRTIGQSQRSLWALFDDFNARNASVVFSELEWE